MCVIEYPGTGDLEWLTSTTVAKRSCGVPTGVGGRSNAEYGLISLRSSWAGPITAEQIVPIDGHEDSMLALLMA